MFNYHKFPRCGINYFMELINQILAEMGADMSRAFTVCMGECAYFKGVKGVTCLSAQKITIMCGKNLLTITGENLSVAQFFQGDLIVKGGICGVQIEKSM